MSPIQPETNAYNQDLAIELGSLVQHAYNIHTKFKEGQDWQNYQVEGYSDLEIFMADPFYEDQHKPFGFVATKENNVYVVFRGSSNYTDWCANIMAQISPFTSFNGNIHPGFLRMFGSCWNSTINPSLLRYTSRFAKNLFITGHSLGGALATLCVIDAIKVTDISPTVYTFASPKVGDADFVTAYQSLGIPHYSVVNTKDLVPRLPFQAAGKYRPVGIELKHTRNYGSRKANHLLNNYIENC